VGIKLLSEHTFTKIRYDGPRRSQIQVKVEASAPVNVYGVAADRLEAFRKNRHSNLFEFSGKTDLDKVLSLPLDAADEWHLILENRSDKPVAVHYEVFDV
jgi:hypothetical protein